MVTHREGPPAGSTTEVPWWGAVSAGLAPFLLIGGWTLAARLQPQRFDAVRDTISQLAAVGMPHRWVMTTALAGLGACHLTTAAALRPAARAGRLVLALGGLGTLSVAAHPLPGTGGSSWHTASAAVAFVALSLWPALAAAAAPARPDGRTAPPLRSPLLRAPLRLAATAVLTVLLVWFFLALRDDGPLVGLSERAAAGAQSLWPLVVVLGLRVARRRSAEQVAAG